ncbi:DUF4365 domain-containing protein [Kribbella sp. CA-245084]|uniref:DUF4365 domain-containing protein n=1 Tax=Kribbella sp. CA-245084 TaxID=3239940 RepID=UPI003D8A124D
MTLPVPEKNQTGGLGESLAGVAFQEIGWAPPVKIPQDIGDDLLTFARDKFGNDLSAPVLVQVKASPTEYNEPTHKIDGRHGWWFAEPDADHFDHWVKFGLPYLLVLQDNKAKVTYWAHVEPRAIVSTGKGRKIFVPQDQRIDLDSFDALIAIAISHRTNELEGSAWSGHLSNLAPSERLRAALVTPRLVAPHPNRQQEELCYEEAIALLLRGRLSNLDELEKRCPSLKDWPAHKDWSWRFAGALHSVLANEGDDGALELLANTAKTPFERDACNVVRACLAFSSGTWLGGQALEFLQAQDDSKLVDRGWVLAQRAHLLLEGDRPEAAVTAATEALRALQALDGDPSVRAIRGGCAAVLYSAAGFGRGDLETAITAQDNAASWWRALDINRALGKDLTDRFEGWTSARRIRFTTSSSYSELNAVRWNAAFCGAWGSWRYLALQLAQLVLTTGGDAAATKGALKLLIDAGHKTSAKDAARRLWASGPVDGLRSMVEELVTSEWSKRSEGAALATIAFAGDLLDTAAADQTVARIVSLLATDGDVRHHAGGGSNRWNEVDSALRRLLTVASLASQSACADLICSRFSDSAGIADSLMRIAGGLRLTSLPPAAITQLRQKALSRDDHYRTRLLEILASLDQESVLELRQLVAGGDQQAVRSLLATGSTLKEDWDSLGQAMAERVRGMISDASGDDGTSKYTQFVHDQLHDLALAAYHTCDLDLWGCVIDALSAGTLLANQLETTVRFLAANFADLPPDIQSRLRSVVPELKALADPFGSGRGIAVAKLTLEVAAGTLDDDEVLNALLQLHRSADKSTLTGLFHIWGSPHNLSFMISMSVDADPDVRAEAAYGLVRVAAKQPELTATVELTLGAALRLDDGCRLPSAVAQALRDFPDVSLPSVRSELGEHPSALVRSYLDPIAT